MISFDPSQRRVLGLDPARHARVLGAPGTGKTRVLVEAYAKLIETDGWAEGEVLVIAPNRVVAARLRGDIERRCARALGGTPVRTTTSLAFAVLSRGAAIAGRAAPRLLTGTAHDEVIAGALGVESGEAPPAAAELRALFSAETLRSEPFRAELRELARVLDDFSLSPAELLVRLDAAHEAAGSRAFTLAPDPELAESWQAGLRLLVAVAARMRAERPDDFTSSGLRRAAAAAVRADEAIPVPRLVLIDDAHELGEGELALLAALVGRGARVWAFGDPDIATGAFHGERVRILGGVATELARRGAAPQPGAPDEQSVVLETVHRHGPELRGFVRELTERIGSGGAGPQRSAESVGAQHEGPDGVEFAVVVTLAEQLGVIAHRLRRRRLGLDGRAPLPWSEMAVICRSRAEVMRAARALAGHQVPTSIAAGGVVLREHQLVRELIRLLQHALGIAPLDGAGVLELLGGVTGGLDPVALRRLRGALRLQETREARAQGRPARSVDERAAEAFELPGESPVIDSAGGRRLRRLGLIVAAAMRVRVGGGTARETLWALWDGVGLATPMQELALTGRGSRADEAHRRLDAVLGLFFALQRHEEQDNERPVAELLEELLTSAVPEDSLAAHAARDVVTVTTPQGVIGREFSVVCLLDLQDGVWPNLRARGSLLGVAALERWLRGDAASIPSRRDTLHDELRLLAHSCARARHEVLAVAVADEDHHPSAFFGLGRDRAVTAPLPSSRLTLRGAVAEMRRRLVLDPTDAVALESLVALAEAEAPGAAPGEWYGVLAPSSEAPLVDLDGDPDAMVAVSPSRLEDAERCPLDWAISRLGGGTTGVGQGIGTLLHRALEQAPGPDAEALLEIATTGWESLPFDSVWEAERARLTMEQMVRGLAEYLAEFAQSNRELVGREAGFSLPLGRAELVGTADRLEARLLPDGRVEVSVVDLKTGRARPSAAELDGHAQLQAYQLGVALGAFAIDGPGERAGRDAGAGADVDPDEGSGPDIGEGTGGSSAGIVNGGARLLYVHPGAVPSRTVDAGQHFTEVSQGLLDAEAQRRFAARVAEVAKVMAGGSFVARVEHHCSNGYRLGGACRLHIIPAVSRA